MCETRRKYNSQQFDLPPPKGEVPTPSKVQEEPISSSNRRSPVLGSSNDSDSLHMSGYDSRTDLLSIEMSMKTVEMLALIKGTTPQEAYLLTLAEQLEAEAEEAQQEGLLCPEDSLLMHRHYRRTVEDEDYLMGEQYADCSDIDNDDTFSLDGELRGFDEGKEGEDEEEEIFEIEM